MPIIQCPECGDDVSAGGFCNHCGWSPSQEAKGTEMTTIYEKIWNALRLAKQANTGVTFDAHEALELLGVLECYDESRALLQSDYLQTISALKAGNEWLRKSYNNLLDAINDVNLLYWDLDGNEERDGEMKLAIESILAQFSKIAAANLEESEE